MQVNTRTTSWERYTWLALQEAKWLRRAAIFLLMIHLQLLESLNRGSASCDK